MAVSDATSILYFVKDGKILLVRKGKDGAWQGVPIVGDPAEFADSNNVFRPSIEIGLVPMRTTKIAEQAYKSDKDLTKQHTIHGYICDEWSGELTAPDEYEVQWFETEDMPYSEMYPDRRYWLPLALTGTPVRGEHIVGDDGMIVEHHVSPVEELSDDAPTSQ